MHRIVPYTPHAFDHLKSQLGQEVATLYTRLGALRYVR